MHQETIELLNDINRRFYLRFAVEFSSRRLAPWPGWSRLLRTLEREPQAPRGRGLAILDVGCGNGRLGSFLGERLPASTRYWGLDGSQPLLAEARRRLAGRRVSFVCADLLLGALPFNQPPRFDLVTAYGVMHHVPGRRERRALLGQLAGLLVPGGVLAAAFWQFADAPRFRKRILDWSKSPVPVDPGDLEPGDHLLRWGGASEGNGAVRYCHHFTDEEIDALIDLPGMTVHDRYASEGGLNTHVILGRG